MKHILVLITLLMTLGAHSQDGDVDHTLLIQSGGCHPQDGYVQWKVKDLAAYGDSRVTTHTMSLHLNGTHWFDNWAVQDEPAQIFTYISDLGDGNNLVRGQATYDIHDPTASWQPKRIPGVTFCFCGSGEQNQSVHLPYTLESEYNPEGESHVHQWHMSPSVPDGDVGGMQEGWWDKANAKTTQMVNQINGN